MAIKENSDLNPDGSRLGQTAADKIAFYGASPVAQPAGAAQAAITDLSGGTAAPTNGVATITATYNQTILANAFATLVAQTNAIRSALVTVGIMKGAA